MTAFKPIGWFRRSLPTGSFGLPTFGSVFAARAAFAYDTFADVSTLNLNGTTAQAGNVLRLTQTAWPFQAGSAFHLTPVDITADTSFSTEFSFRIIGGDGTNGGEGFAFVLQNSSAGAEALGPAGGGLGYSGIGSSIAVAFDTYQNANNTNGNQVDILLNGDTITKVVDVDAPFDLNGDDQLRYAWIDYNGTNNELKVYLSTTSIRPETPLITTTIDLPSLLGGSAYAGFTGATGGLENYHDIVSWQFSSSDT